ncbi:MAG: hypothetical protein HY044_02210 [Candidatus Woesebacteria bacterium]|nr:MAG: hypothetical protein HY044_02210 [Candidatus Woesebacteria bacterium]
MSLAEAKALNLETLTLSLETSSLLNASIDKLKNIPDLRNAIVDGFFGGDLRTIRFEIRGEVYEVNYKRVQESQFLSIARIAKPTKPTEERISMLILPNVSGFLHIEETSESGQVKVVQNSSNSATAKERILEFLDKI